MRFRASLVLAVLLSACRDQRVIQPTLALPTPGMAIPAFDLPLHAGGRFSSAAMGGRPAVLFLWSTHCPTSRRALADYRELRQRYGSEATFLLLSDDATASELQLLPVVLADSGVTGPVLLARGSLGRLFDHSATAPERDTARVQFVLPAYLLVDSTGTVAARSWGPDATTVRLALARLVARRPAA